MVCIYTISDKVLMGKQINILPAYLSECFFKNNIKIQKQCILPTNTSFFDAVDTKNDKIHIFLVDKANENLNNFIAEITNSVIIENPYLKNAVSDYYKKIGQVVEKETENEWKISSLARAIVNPYGTTQGYLLNFKNQIFCVLPNNYDAARQMFDDVVLEELKNSQKKMYKNYTFKTFGLTENGIKQILSEQLKNKNKVTINLFSKPFEVDIVIKSPDDNPEIDSIAQKILLKLDKYIYSVEDVPIENVVYKLLKLNDIKVSFVEDITGGELCSRLNKQYFDAKNYIASSFVLTNNDYKTKLLGITQNLNNENDLPNLVYEMAAKSFSMTDADIVVATIGNCLPQNNVPCGLSYIAVGDRKEIHVYKNIFKGNTQEIIDSITVASYFYLIKKLKKNDFHFEKTTV